MNRLKRREKRAVARGCHPFRRDSWPGYEEPLNRWDVYVEKEAILGPRGLALTRRQAVALAYAVSVCKPTRLTVTVGDAS